MRHRHGTGLLPAIENVLVLASAVLLIFWAFSDRSAGWTVVLVAAIVVMGAIFVRRLRAWMRLKRLMPPGDGKDEG
jgi:hypothetical protein